MKDTRSWQGNIALLPVALGTAVYLFCGVAVAILASTSLTADNYVNYVSFVSVGGIFVLGVGTAIEQETNLVYLRFHGEARSIWRFMIPRVGALIAIIWLALLLPIGSWQEKLFGDLQSVVKISVILGTPGLFFTCVARGITNGQADFRRLGKAHAMYGICSVLVPIVLRISGTSLANALIIGQAIAWSAPMSILIRSLGTKKIESFVKVSSPPHLSGWLVAANIALLSNLLSSQVIFRVQGESLPAEVIAEAQILIMVSCFAASLTLSFMPQLIAAHRKASNLRTNRESSLERIFLLGATFLPLGTAVFRRPISQTLLPTESNIPLIDSLFICTPAWFLVVALLFSARSISHEKVKSTAIIWLVGLASLWSLPLVMNNSSVRSLSVSLFFGATVPALIFLIVSFRSKRDERG